MKPTERYLQILQQSDFVADPAQQKAINLLDTLAESLSTRQSNSSSWIARAFGFSGANKRSEGIYFWGGVGRGKTFLMDIFYQCVDIPEKKRIHFHEFMNQIHLELKNHRDLEDPLKHIAEKISREVRLLCLDEFVIIDIGDAMIMSGLLKTLFESGITLVTTSNAAPENLYKDGLQRSRFLPAIALLEQNCRVVNLDGGEDYRLRNLKNTELYYYPHNESAESAIQCFIDESVLPFQTSQLELIVNQRPLSFIFCAEDTVWFDFEQICKTSRSQNDYLEIARCFSTVIVSNIESMDKSNDDAARRFVLLIDVFYDHHVKFICSAAKQPADLYQGERLKFEFERTSSRLIEMQSDQYLGQGHGQE